MNIDINSIYDQMMYWVQIIGPLLAYIATGVYGIIKVIKYVKEFGVKVEDKSTATDAKIESTTNELRECRNEMRALYQDNIALRKEVKRLCNKVDKIQE